MSGKIARPPKLYIDTNHLINIGKVRRSEELPRGQSAEAYRFLDRCIREHYGVILNPFAPIEWTEGNATEQSASQIAAVIDSAKLVYQLEMDQIVYLSEVLCECQRLDPSLHIPDLPKMQSLTPGGIFRSTHAVLARSVPGYFDSVKDPKAIPENIPVESVNEYVKTTLKLEQENPGRYNERIEGWKASMSYDIRHKDEYFRSRKHWWLEWVKRSLKVDKVIAGLNPRVNVEPYLDDVDIENCPAVRLYFDAREKRIKAGYGPQDNEVDDWQFLPVVPYADLVLIDRNFRTFILQADKRLEAKVFANAADAAKVLRKQEFVW